MVQSVNGTTVEVRWDDGHVSILSGGALVTDKDPAQTLIRRTLQPSARANLGG